MKKLVIILVLISYGISSRAQETGSIKTDYRQKSKNQKSAAFVLLIGGSALIATGFLIGDRKSSSFGDAGTGVIMGGLGFISMVASIPLFIASGKNKRRAATVSLGLRGAPFIVSGTITAKAYPAISIRTRL